MMNGVCCLQIKEQVCKYALNVCNPNKRQEYKARNAKSESVTRCQNCGDFFLNGTDLVNEAFHSRVNFCVRRNDVLEGLEVHIGNIRSVVVVGLDELFLRGKSSELLLDVSMTLLFVPLDCLSLGHPLF